MKRYVILTTAMIIIIVAVGCTSGGKQGKHHKTDLPDPATFDAHFGDIDSDGDGVVTRDEFKAFFQNSDPNVFNAVDLNQDASIDHDEWHAFKEAHGIKHHE